MKKVALVLTILCLMGCSSIPEAEVPKATIGMVGSGLEAFDNIYELKEKELAEKLTEISKIEDKLEYFKAYKALIKEYSNWFDPPVSVYDVYTEQDILYMQKCVETETYQQAFGSKCNVANVILNRVNHPTKFADTPYEVVTSAHQFVYGRDNITETSILAVEYAFMMEDTTQGALFFHSFEDARPTFCGANYIFTDEGGHHFYK